MKKLLLAAVFLLAPGYVLADDHEAIVEFWKCELREGKKMEDVEANNSKWLALARKTVGSDEIESYVLHTVVGDQTKFWFADVYPNMAAWSAQKSADETDEGQAIENMFDELLDCSDNRLYRSEATQ
jgi:hypothetical protein